MNAERVDKYPSRVEANARVLPRRDPVVFDSPLVDAGPLTPDELTTYERDGFMFLPGFFGVDVTRVLYEELGRVLHSEEIRQSEVAITEPTSGEIRSVFAVHTVSELFAKLMRHEGLVSIVRQILGSDVYIHQSRLNFKPGFRGKEFYWHSDFETWHAEDGMPDMRAISCSIALTENYEFNGPLMLVPGSHKQFLQCTGRTPEKHFQQSLKKQDYGVPSDEQLSALVEQSEIVVPKGPAGSVILFESNIMHGSNGNITPYPRSNIFFVYNSIENSLVEPFAADECRPWYLGNREPEVVTSIDFVAELLQPA